MSPDYRRDFETVEEHRERLKREDQAEPQAFETDIGAVLEQFIPEQPVSDTVVERDGFRHRLRVYANGTRITTGLGSPVEPLPGSDGIRPGNDAAGAAFKAGREDEYIDRMKARYGGNW